MTFCQKRDVSGAVQFPPCVSLRLCQRLQIGNTQIKKIYEILFEKIHEFVFSTEGHERAVLPMQAVRGQVPLLLLRAQTQENVAQYRLGRKN